MQVKMRFSISSGELFMALLSSSVTFHSATITFGKICSLRFSGLVIPSAERRNYQNSFKSSACSTAPAAGFGSPQPHVQGKFKKLFKIFFKKYVSVINLVLLISYDLKIILIQKSFWFWCDQPHASDFLGCSPEFLWFKNHFDFSVINIMLLIAYDLKILLILVWSTWCSWFPGCVTQGRAGSASCHPQAQECPGRAFPFCVTPCQGSWSWKISQFPPFQHRKAEIPGNVCKYWPFSLLSIYKSRAARIFSFYLG